MATAEQEFQEFLRELEAGPQARLAGKDAGPEARRAAAGMAPNPITPADPFDPNTVRRDLRGGTIGERFSAALASPGTVTATSNQAAVMPGPTQGRPVNWTNNPTEGDPGAAMIASGLMGAGAGRVIPLAAQGAPLFARALSRAVAGGTEGAVASGTAGGDPVAGGVLGAGLGMGSAVAGKGAQAARADADLYKEIGRAGTGKAQEKVAQLGADQIVKTARDFGIADAQGWRARAEASGAAKQQVGKRVGDAFSAVDAAGHASQTQNVVQALETLKGEVGKTTEGQQLVKAITEKQEALRKLYPDTIPASALNREIGDLQALGYSGGQVGQLSPAATRKVPRLMARAMDKELDATLALAKKDPALAATVESIPELNRQYRSLVAIDTIAKRQAAKEPFAKTFRDLPLNKQGEVIAKGAGSAAMRGAGALAAGAGIGAGVANALPPTPAPRPERKVAPKVVPIVESLAMKNGTDMHKHVEDAVFGP